MNALKGEEPLVPPPRRSKYYNVHVCFTRENGRLYVWLSTEGVLGLCNRVVSEKAPPIFGPLLPAEYVTELSGRTDAPKVRGHLTDTYNYSNPPAHAR